MKYGRDDPRDLVLSKDAALPFIFFENSSTALDWTSQSVGGIFSYALYIPNQLQVNLKSQYSSDTEIGKQLRITASEAIKRFLEWLLNFDIVKTNAHADITETTHLRTQTTTRSNHKTWKLNANWGI